MPLYEVLYGALTTSGGSLTWYNFDQTFSQAVYRNDFISSLKIAAETSAIGGFFGLWLACAVVASSPRSPLRRIVGSGSAVLAYFAGVPLAFAFIATLGRFGELTMILQSIGINLNNTSFTISSLTGVEIAYVYFQVPLMVLLVTPALEGLRAEWREAATGLGASTLRATSATSRRRCWRRRSSARCCSCSATPSPPTRPRYALVGDTRPARPGHDPGAAINGNVLVNENGIGLALGVEMIVVIAIDDGRYAGCCSGAPGGGCSEAPPSCCRAGARASGASRSSCLAALFFLGPLAASIRFSLIQPNGKDGFGNYTQILHDRRSRDSLWTSLEIAGLTTAIMLVLMLPTVVLVRLRLPRLALLVESVSVLPIVIPPIVMGAGLAALQKNARHVDRQRCCSPRR